MSRVSKLMDAVFGPSETTDTYAGSLTTRDSTKGLNKRCDALLRRVKMLESLHHPVCTHCGKPVESSPELGHDLKGECCKKKE